MLIIQNNTPRGLPRPHYLLWPDTTVASGCLLAAILRGGVTGQTQSLVESTAGLINIGRGQASLSPVQLTSVPGTLLQISTVGSRRRETFLQTFYSSLLKLP